MDQMDTKQIAPSGATLQQPLVFNPTTQHWTFIGSAPISVATLAARPAVASVPNAQLVFVESQRSWYRSDLLSASYLRDPIADPSWAAQVAWGINTATGSDENIGSVASPLATFAEYRARVPVRTVDQTISIAAGSVFGAGDPLALNQTLSPATTVPALTITGVATLGANLLVASSSDEAGNAAPLIDAGAALTPGTLIQATDGAQAGAVASVIILIAGNQYRTSPWTSAAGARVGPPAPGDHIAAMTLPTVASVAIVSLQPTSPALVNLNVAAITNFCGSGLVYRQCQLPGFAYFASGGRLTFTACVFTGGVVFNVQQAGQLIFFQCGIIRTGLGAPNLQATGTPGSSIALISSVIQGGGLDANEGALISVNRVGIFAAPTTGVDAHRLGVVDINGTLYGTGTVGVGTRAREGGRIAVLSTVIPTLAAAGQELQLEAAGTANPVLLGVPTAAAPLTSWNTANPWTGAPFNRNVVSYSTGASIVNYV